MKINIEYKQDLGASSLYDRSHRPRPIYMAYTKRSVVNTTYHCALLSWITRRHSTEYTVQNIFKHFNAF